jgi:hypothetical protein
MGSMTKITTVCGLALSIGVLVPIGQSAPANAQGGIVCAYGTKKYKDCCHQSYKAHPKLGARARGDDIDACMNPKKAAKKPAKDAPKETSTEPPKTAPKSDGAPK